MSSHSYHIKAREALIAKDRGLRYDHIHPASDLERKADAVIRKIREIEAGTVWKREEEQLNHVFPGMGFLTGKDIIEKTQLFKVLKKMPKGALLHAHTDAMCDGRKLISFALGEPAMHVRVAVPLSPSNLSTALPEFKALNPAETAQFANAPSLTSDSYALSTWVPIQKARQEFQFGGPEGFDKWVMAGLTINPSEAYGTHNTPNKIWEKFKSTFGVCGGLIHFEPVWKRYLRELFLSSIDDGISYLECRINFFPKFMVRENGTEDFSHADWIRTFAEAAEDVKQQMKAQGRDDEFIGAKIIYTTLRFMTADELEWYTEDCIQLKQQFPNVIAGFDLVGEEDTGQPLLYYIEPLLRFQKRVKDLGLDLPFIFHAGETLGDGNHVDSNLYDAIVLGTKRIGHGFSLAKHPELMKICREKGIALEVCPISNEILRLTTTMPMHPLPVLLNNGVPVTLNCDDPAAFGNLGLTYDFYQVVVASEITGLLTLGIMARQSLEFSCMEEKEKADAIRRWEKRWTSFLQDVTSLTLPTAP